MKLYYLPGACSLASLISLKEAGVPVQAIAVDRQKRTADGQDFLSISAKGYVPALVLDNGEVLSETAALLPYIGQMDPTGKLIPPAGTLGHFGVAEWCAYVNSEVHKSFTPLFRPGSTDDMKAAAKATFEIPIDLASVISCPSEDWHAVLKGFGIAPAEKNPETGAVTLWRFSARARPEGDERPPRRSDRPQSGRPATEQAKPEGEATAGARPPRSEHARPDNRQGGRRDNRSDNRSDRRPDNRQDNRKPGHSSAPPERRSKPIDPDSPFAALAALLPPPKPAKPPRPPKAPKPPAAPKAAQGGFRYRPFR
jgi:hypothetical protein